MRKAAIKNMKAVEGLPLMTVEETMGWLDSRGIRYEVCDTQVPATANKVSCGKPTDIGDYMIKEYHNLPSSAVRLHPVIDVPAKGDSMIEADIHEDDWLQLEVGVLPSK